MLLLLYAEGSYTKMVTLGRSLAQAGRAAGNSQMQAIGTRVEGGALIHLGRLAEGAALMAAALPADPQPPMSGPSRPRPCSAPPTCRWARWTSAPR